MGSFHHTQQITLFIKMAILLPLFALKSSSLLTESPPSFEIAKQGCLNRCGDINIPYPFGTTENCSQHTDFLVTCNHTFTPPKLFLQDSAVEILNITLDGQLRILQPIARDCYSKNGTRISGRSYGTDGDNYEWIKLPSYLTVNKNQTKFFVVGCDTVGIIYDHRQQDQSCQTTCIARCNATESSKQEDLKEGSCNLGSGCCQRDFLDEVSMIGLELMSFNDYESVNVFNNCGYAFLVEESGFSFSQENLRKLNNGLEKLPMVVDWTFGNLTCNEAQANSSSYGCESHGSECYTPSNGHGYQCSCKKGYQGYPYLIHGCKDIDECQDPSQRSECVRECKNLDGSFKCSCPKGYRGDGRRDGTGCIRGESLLYKLAAGISVGLTALLLTASFLYVEYKRRRLIKMKQKFFLRNGGHLLQEKLSKKERSPDMAKIFSHSELRKATNNFDDSMITGQGGFGTVYKGFLPDNGIVAIKKSKLVDPNQVEQFVNEVIVLSQINHRNVVKLIGCCFDTEVPLLVYEFMGNGTLSEHIHNQAKAPSLFWDLRLRIAAETAGVLSYLHSAASTPIIHRDIKPENILLDDNLTAKVADFGASRFVPVDQTQLSTVVQGTVGYLDPEYMQTNQLTEKSDVYSFGVVLLELLTGKKALCYGRPENQRNLAKFFLSELKQDRLFQILDDNIVCEWNKDQLIEVARLAERCLNLKGEDRPSMKDVARELEGLILRGNHSLVAHIDDVESLLDEGFNDHLLPVVIRASNSSSSNSLIVHIASPICSMER